MQYLILHRIQTLKILTAINIAILSTSWLVIITLNITNVKLTWKEERSLWRSVLIRRSQWPCGIRRWYEPACLLGFRLFVCYVCVCVYVFALCREQPLVKMCSNETYGRVRVGKNLSDRFPIRNGLKQGDALSPLLFNVTLEYAIRRVQINQDGLKLNVTHQLLAYADDVNILGGSVHTVKKKCGSFSSCYLGDWTRSKCS